MTLTLVEAGRRSPQDQLQAEMVRVWRQMDHLDAEAERRVIQRVAELRADILDRLASLPTAEFDGHETFQSTSLRAFAAELDDVANRFAQRYGMDLAADMRGAASYSDDAHRTALANLARNMDVPPALVSFSPLGLADHQIEAAVLFNQSAIKNVSQAVVQTVNRELQAVVFGGQSRWDAVRNVRAALSTDARGRTGIGALTQRAITIERTGIIAAMNIAAEHAYRQATEELPDLMVEWITAQDKRVDPICTGLNGATKKPGGTFPGGYVAPPAHPRCRCRIVASMPGWKDLAKKPPVPAPLPVQEPGEFTSLAEAERGMQAKYPHIMFDFAGAHKDTINPSMVKFHALAQEWPEVAARLEYVGTAFEPRVAKRYGGGFATMNARAIAYATTDGKAIALNPKYYSSMEILSDAAKRSAAMGFHPKGTEPVESFITHEFGHQIDHWSQSRGAEQILPGVWPSGIGLRNDMVRLWLQDRKRAAGNVAQYAKTNAAEEFASLFAATEYTKPPPAVVRQFKVLLSDVIRAPAIKSGVANIRWTNQLPDTERQQAIDALKALAKRLGVTWP